MTPAEFMSAAKCPACFGVGTAQGLRISILSAIVNKLDPDMPTTPQALLDQGACFGCLGMSTADIMELVLLTLIFNLIGGTSGQGCMLCGEGDPVAAPTDCTCAWYVNLLNSTTWYWDNRPAHMQWYQFG